MHIPGAPFGPVCAADWGSVCTGRVRTEAFEGSVLADPRFLGGFFPRIKGCTVVRCDATTGLVAEQGLIKVIHTLRFYVCLILFLRPSVDTDCVATPAVAADFSFNHLQRTPGQTPEWHIFGLRPGCGGRRGGGQSHVADVGKQYPPLSWHQCSQRGYQAPGPHTDRDKS